MLPRLFFVLHHCRHYLQRRLLLRERRQPGCQQKPDERRAKQGEQSGSKSEQLQIQSTVTGAPCGLKATSRRRPSFVIVVS